MKIIGKTINRKKLDEKIDQLKIKLFDDDPEKLGWFEELFEALIEKRKEKSEKKRNKRKR